MPDPLQALPTELWSLCIEFAIAGRLAGPLELIMVSQSWGSALLDSPSLWTQIYIQNGEDEISRISTFLHLSRQCALHIDVRTVLPTVDSLRLVTGHISRVKTISIMPGASHTVTALHARQWKGAAAYVLESLSNGMQLSEVESPGCIGVAICDSGQWYYHVIILYFTVAARVASAHEPSRMWENYLAKYASLVSPVPYCATEPCTRIIPALEDEDFGDRNDFFSSIAGLIPYGKLQLVIGASQMD